MSDNRNTCVQNISSSCIDYSGEELTAIDNDNLPCEVNINDILKELDVSLKIIQNGLNLTTLNKQCLTFDNSTIVSNDLFQILIDKICGVQANVNALQEIVNNFKLENLLLNIDLKCLSANECLANANTITQILGIIISEICAIKTQINSLVGTTHGNTIYIPS